MDILAAAALSYGSDQGPKLVSSRTIFIYHLIVIYASHIVGLSLE